MKKVVNGSQAAALAAILARTEVASVYPITPATQIGETLAEYEAAGRFRGRLLRVESEHSAMASLLGAATAGARTFTATSSQGLAYMHEMLHWVSGARLPVVMAEVNRALAAPWILWSDQTDSLSQRDTGWLQLYCASVQEVLDTVLIAFKAAEEVELPAMVVMDGFVLSHTYEPVDVPEEARVDAFLPARRAEPALDAMKPAAFGSLLLPRDYMRLRRRLAYDMERAAPVLERVGAEFGRRFGRPWGLIKPYRAEDARTLLVMAGAAGSTAEAAVDELRAKGLRAGSLRLRSVRPFPAEAIRRVLKPGQSLAVVDRSYSSGAQGILAQELSAALYADKERPEVSAFVAGIGGADITPELLGEIWREADSGSARGEPVWMEDAR